uniref:Uncharacterized protein n=1 Tax=Triticum urartu TaxID=4572 RepID=A0A8R7RED3_TRIUA
MDFRTNQCGHARIRSGALCLVLALAITVAIALLQQGASLLIGLRGLLLRLLCLERLQLDMVVVANTQEGDAVAEEVDGGDRVPDHGPGEGNQEPVLDHSRDIHGERGGLANEQEDRKVERKGAERVCAEDEEVGLEGADGAQPGQLDEDPGHEQEAEAAGRDVVERGDGVERDALGGEQDLDEHEAGGLEGDGGELERDAAEVEPGLAVGGDGDAEGDGEHVEHGGGAEGLLLEEDADGVDGDGHERLEHLDEGDGEVDVGRVGEPERHGVERADGHDGGGVELRRHGRGGGRLDDPQDADEPHGERGAEAHVHHGERDGEGPVVHLGVEDVLVVDDDGEGEEDPHRHVAVGQQHLPHHRLRQAAGAPAAGHRSLLRLRLRLRRRRR